VMGIQQRSQWRSISATSVWAWRAAKQRNVKKRAASSALKPKMSRTAYNAAHAAALQTLSKAENHQYQQRRRGSASLILLALAANSKEHGAQ